MSGEYWKRIQDHRREANEEEIRRREAAQASAHKAQKDDAEIAQRKKAHEDDRVRTLTERLREHVTISENILQEVRTQSTEVTSAEMSRVFVVPRRNLHVVLQWGEKFELTSDDRAKMARLEGSMFRRKLSKYPIFTEFSGGQLEFELGIDKSRIASGQLGASTGSYYSFDFPTSDLLENVDPILLFIANNISRGRVTRVYEIGTSALDVGKYKIQRPDDSVDIGGPGMGI